MSGMICIWDKGQGGRLTTCNVLFPSYRLCDLIKLAAMFAFMAHSIM